MQRLREEMEHLQERFGESVTELDTRTTFMKKTIKVRRCNPLLHCSSIHSLTLTFDACL